MIFSGVEKRSLSLREITNPEGRKPKIAHPPRKPKFSTHGGMR
jgi:hypothetical protein